MAGTITIEVPNLLAIQARFEELGVVKVPTAMRKIIVAGAKPMKAAIKAEAPVGKTHNLSNSVRFKSGKTTKALASIAGAHEAMAYYVVGPFGKGSYHRHLVIEGHEIVGHAPNLTHTGKRTSPNGFVARGRDRAQAVSLAAIEQAAKAALEAATKL